jgi:hypothetical protein
MNRYVVFKNLTMLYLLVIKNLHNKNESKYITKYTYRNYFSKWD